MSTPNGAPGGGSPPPDSNSNGFNPSMAIIIVVLIGACLVVAIFSMYIRRCTQGENSTNRQPSRSPSIRFFERPGDGLERNLIDTLPIVSFSVVKGLKNGKEDLECAVCLERFEDEDSLRLLPKCSHVFHSECIDEWFGSHSTCPLCRISLKVTPAEVDAGVPAVGEVSRRILEAQEELFGSSRLAESVLGENDVLEGSGREVLSRDTERNSARTALFRNSDSFRQAARGVEVRERLASLSARYPSSSTDISKAPQRASSLSCVSLQRTSSTSSCREVEAPFRYGSQRYGAAGSSSLVRLSELDPSAPSPAHLVAENTVAESLASSSLNNNNSWIPDNGIPRPVLGKPRSGPQRKRPSLRGLRGSFSALHRSASEGRVELIAMDALPVESTPNAADFDNSTSTLAQRTLLWLSGGSKHARSASARASLEQRTVLQQILTE